MKEWEGGLEVENGVWEMGLGMGKLGEGGWWMENVEVD